MTTEAKMPKPVRIPIGPRTVAKVGVVHGLVVLKAKGDGDDAWLGMNAPEAREMARALDTMADAVEAAQAQTPIIDADGQGHIDPAAAADVAARLLKETSGE